MRNIVKPTKRNYTPCISHKETASGMEYRFMLGNRIISRHATNDAAQAAWNDYVKPTQQAYGRGSL
jgi:hypothetical protein